MCLKGGRAPPYESKHKLFAGSGGGGANFVAGVEYEASGEQVGNPVICCNASSLDQQKTVHV